jgi:imidazoleglycerol-phosphate dehydratase
VLELNLDGSGTAKISTGVGFFDHVLELLARHAAIDLTVTARGDLHVLLHQGRNGHHIAEAIFKCLAKSLRMAVESDPRVTDVPSTKGTL